MTIRQFLEQTVDGNLNLRQQHNYLASAEPKNGQELAEAVEYLLSRMPPVPRLSGAIDMAGTGGSGLDTINTSTLAALVIAACGVPVAKHGNRSASGKFGSFDLLEALGVPIKLSPQELQTRFNELNVAFLYAKSYHPVMRHFAEARQAIGRPTFFNILGPLLSPVSAPRQVIGVYDASKMRLIAETCQALGKERVLVVRGSDGLDEATVCGPTQVVELATGRISEYELTPTDFGLKHTYQPKDIRGGGAKTNIDVAHKVLNNQANPAHRDLVLVNAALGLSVAGTVTTASDGYQLAKKTLETGKAQSILQRYKTPSILKKIVEHRQRDTFKKPQLKQSKTRTYHGGLIAEIKKGSPSEGDLDIDVDVAARARWYEAHGAQAISVVTEPRFFKGSLEDLRLAKEATTATPILCKDFVTETKQLDSIAAHRADMVLLIAAILDDISLAKLKDHAESLGLQVLCEIHNQIELDMALSAGATLIGVNARNLHDFSIDLTLFDTLHPHLPDGVLAVAESGMRNYHDLPHAADGHLVGTVIMRSPFPQLKVKELAGRPLLKLCGIRDVASAKLCEKLGVDIIGLNFVERSHRKVPIDEAKKIRAVCETTLVIGIFEDQSPAAVAQIAQAVGLDAIQMPCSDNCKFYQGIGPIIQSRTIDQTLARQPFLSIIDSGPGGSGKKFDHRRLTLYEPSLIAGGIDLKIAQQLLETKKPLGIDTASGIETNKKTDHRKIKGLAGLFVDYQY